MKAMKKTHTPLMIATLAATLVLPLINVTLIWPLYVELASDITASQPAAEAVYILYRALTLIVAYATAACVGYSLVTRASRIFVLLVSFLSLPVVYYALVVTDANFSPVSTAYIEMNIANCAFEMLQLATVVGAVMWLAAKKKPTMHLRLFNFSGGLSRAAIICPAVVFLWRLVSNLTETVSLLVEIGAPQNISEVYTLVTPHVESVIFLIVGYFLTFIMSALFLVYRKSINQLQTK